MKSLKKLVLAVVVLATFSVFDQSGVSAQKRVSFARVRVVTNSSEQKKKDPQHSTAPAPKPAPAAAAKDNSGFFCDQTNTVKSKLAVANGGAPK